MSIVRVWRWAGESNAPAATDEADGGRPFREKCWCQVAPSGRLDRMKYQLLPDLTEAEYAALKAHIAAWGIQVPVVRDELGHTLDGHHRERAARELGIKAIRPASEATELEGLVFLFLGHPARCHNPGILPTIGPWTLAV
jgi:hypothetical protein